MFIPLLTVVALGGAVGWLLLRSRAIQPPDVLGSQVSDECLNNVLTRLSRNNNAAESI